VVFVDLPADELAEVGGGADELLGDAFLEAEVGEGEAQKLAQDLLFVAVLLAFDYGELVGGEFLRTGDAVEDHLSITAVIGTVHVTGGGQFLDIGGLTMGKFEQEVVSHDLAGGFVLGFGFFFPPSEEFAEDGQISRGKFLAAGDASPVFAGAFVGDFRTHASELGFGPIAPTAALKVVALPFPDFEKVGDILKGVFNLLGGEWATAPVGARLLAADAFTDDARDECGVAKGETRAAQAFGDLDIDDFARLFSSGVDAEPDFFAASVDDDGDFVGGHQIPPGREVLDFIGIDGDTAMRSGELEQAEFRPIGELGDELGIEADDSRLFDFSTELFEFILIDNQRRVHGIESRRRSQKVMDEVKE